MILDDYYDLRDEISERSRRLFGAYAHHVQCGFGCYYCCDEIAVLPIELEALRRYLGETGVPPEETRGGPPEDAGETPEERLHSVDRSVHGTLPAEQTQSGEKTPRRRCAFLGRNGECTVYAGRPIICRTHGLPLAYRVYEYDREGRPVRTRAPEYMDLWCDLNFRELPGSEADSYFDAHGRINMDRVNLRIEELNRRFLASPDGARYGAGESAPLGSVLAK